VLNFYTAGLPECFPGGIEVFPIKGKVSATVSEYVFNLQGNELFQAAAYD